LHLTPSFPLSFEGEGEDFVKRGEAPLKLLITYLGVDALLRHPNQSEGLKAKPLREGGWEIRLTPKRGRGWVENPPIKARN